MNDKKNALIVSGIIGVIVIFVVLGINASQKKKLNQKQIELQEAINNADYETADVIIKEIKYLNGDTIDVKPYYDELGKSLFQKGIQDGSNMDYGALDNAEKCFRMGTSSSYENLCKCLLLTKGEFSAKFVLDKLKKNNYTINEKDQVTAIIQDIENAVGSYSGRAYYWGKGAMIYVLRENGEAEKYRVKSNSEIEQISSNELILTHYSGSKNYYLTAIGMQTFESTDLSIFEKYDSSTDIFTDEYGEYARDDSWAMKVK